MVAQIFLNAFFVEGISLTLIFASICFGLIIIPPILSFCV